MSDVQFTIGKPWKKEAAVDPDTADMNMTMFDDWVCPVYVTQTREGWQPDRAWVEDATATMTGNEGPAKAIAKATLIASALQLAHDTSLYHREHFPDLLVGDAQTCMGFRDEQGRLLSPDPEEPPEGWSDSAGCSDEPTDPELLAKVQAAIAALTGYDKEVQP